MVTKKTAVKKPIKKTGKKLAKQVTRKTPVAKKTVRKSTSRKKPAPMRSFHIHKDPLPFRSLKITRQTAYWSVLLLFIMITQLWILRIQIDLANLTNALLLQ